MEILSTFRKPELHSKVYSIYHDLYKMAQSAALMHARSMDLANSEHHNPYHFEHFMELANQQIKKLCDICPEERGSYEKLDMKKLLDEAVRFLNDDSF